MIPYVMHSFVVKQCILLRRNPVKYISEVVFISLSKSNSVMALALNPCISVYNFL